MTSQGSSGTSCLLETRQADPLHNPSYIDMLTGSPRVQLFQSDKTQHLYRSSEQGLFLEEEAPPVFNGGI